MVNILDSEIMYLPGVGPKRAELLQKELGIYTFGDLLYFYPFRYIDRSKIYKISEITDDLPYVQVLARIVNISEVGAGRNRRLTALSPMEREYGTCMVSGITWVLKRLKPNTDYLIIGKATGLANNLVLLTRNGYL
jgi:ATP-dependent DNA helicase RecG